MMGWTEYHTPRTSEAAQEALRASPDLAFFVGGTDLLLDLDQCYRADVGNLVDIGRIDALGTVQVEGEYLTIGAAIPHTRQLENQLIYEHAPYIESIVIKRSSTEGPCGAKGGGEVCSTPTRSVITDALKHACAVDFQRLPVDQDDLLQVTAEGESACG